MKEAIFVGVVVGLMVGIVLGAFKMVQASADQWERNERAFRVECEAVKGRAVWNNKYWECLK